MIYIYFWGGFLFNTFFSVFSTLLKVKLKMRYLRNNNIAEPNKMIDSFFYFIRAFYSISYC